MESSFIFIASKKIRIRDIKKILLESLDKVWAKATISYLILHQQYVSDADYKNKNQGQH